jgi:RND family efflux transporter MFP subunit
MAAWNNRASLAGLVAAAIAGASGLALAQANDQFKVAETEVDDLKAVFATVRSKDRIEARVRTPGTVVTLKVDEGVQVEPGQLLALIADPKIALRMKALDAQIVGLESRTETAKSDYERAEALRQRGVTPQARVDQLKAAFDTATNELKAARAERQVAEQQVAEGQVLAPAAGRVLRVPVTEGSVMMAGESVATIAANEFLLRLELPERHARFLKAGDTLRIGARGLATDQAGAAEGRIVQVYPELQGGRVLADAEVATLGDYFIGERALVWISAGKRQTLVVPADYVFRRFGLDFVSLALPSGKAADVVVQIGNATAAKAGGAAAVEILSGLKPGDALVKPKARP